MEPENLGRTKYIRILWIVAMIESLTPWSSEMRVIDLY